MKLHKFTLGATVHGCFSNKEPNRSGIYKILGHMPERDGVLQYRIESATDRHQRVTTEDCLFPGRQSAEANAPPTPVELFAELNRISARH